MSSKLSKLRFQYAYLKLEEEETKEICHKADTEMKEYIIKKHPDYYKKIYDSIGAQQPKSQQLLLETEEVFTENKDKYCKNKELKSLYRKIAKKTHPDRNNGNSDLFIKSVRAYAENNLGDMLEVANDAKVDIPKVLLSEAITLLEDNIKEVEKKIDTHKKTTAWSWHKSNSNEEKETIVTNILKHLGVKTNET